LHRQKGCVPQQETGDTPLGRVGAAMSNDFHGPRALTLAVNGLYGDTVRSWNDPCGLLNGDMTEGHHVG